MDGKGVGAVAVLCFLGLIAGAIGFLPAYEHNVAVQEGEPTTGTVLSTDVDVRTDDEGEETLADAAIPVEDVDGPVLLVSGGDDRLWNTVALHRAAAERLEGHEYDHEHLVYDDAGHRIMIPYRPTTNRTEGPQYVYGGTTAGYAEADVDHWPRVLETFDTLRDQ